MSTKTKSTKRQSDDLRMVFFKTDEDYFKARALIREGKIPEFIDYTVATLKAVSLLGKRGIRFREVSAPVNKSDLTPKQREDIRDNRANLLKIKSLDLTFFVNRKSEE